MSSRVVHFDIPSDDPERSAEFYARAFGWKIRKYGGPEEYWLVDTGEGTPGINGGIMRRSKPFDRVVNTISVDDIDAAAARVRESGANLLGEKTTIPDVGYLQYAMDPDGNMFGMLQPIAAAAPSASGG